MFAVTVTFTLKPGHGAAFAELVTVNARTSLADEPDCHQFDVCRDPDQPDTVFLYELYTDRAAFEAHMQSPHFQSFDAASAPMVAGKTAHLFPEVLR